MKKIYIVLMICLAAAVSCKKSVSPADEVIREEPLRVRASLSDLTRSHFAAPEDNALVWDADDKIFLWSKYMTSWDNLASKAATDYPVETWGDYYGLLLTAVNAMSDYAPIQGTLDINPASAGSASATFKSSKKVTEWFSQGEGAQDDLYWFGALYPAPASPLEWGYWEQELDPSKDDVPASTTLNQPYFLVSVPSVQDGKSYWEYQRLLAYGLVETPAPGYSCPMLPADYRAEGLATREEIVTGEYSLNFSRFTPVTSLLSFTMQANIPSGETIEIDHMDIMVERMMHGEYSTDLCALSGKVPLFLLFDEDHEQHLHNLFSTPYNNDVPFGDPSVWFPMADRDEPALPKVTLQFGPEHPVTLSSQASSADDPFYAVVIPNHFIDNHVDYDRPPHLVFIAYDADNNPILTKKLSMSKAWSYIFHEGEADQRTYTVYPGIRKGTKYSFNLKLEEIRVPEDEI